MVLTRAQGNVILTEVSEESLSMDVPGDRVKLGVLKVTYTTPNFSVDKNSGTWYDQ